MFHGGGVDDIFHSLLDVHILLAHSDGGVFLHGGDIAGGVSLRQREESCCAQEDDRKSC